MVNKICHLYNLLTKSYSNQKAKIFFPAILSLLNNLYAFWGKTLRGNRENKNNSEYQEKMRVQYMRKGPLRSNLLLFLFCPSATFTTGYPDIQPCLDNLPGIFHCGKWSPTFFNRMLVSILFLVLWLGWTCFMSVFTYRRSLKKCLGLSQWEF